MTKRIRIGVLGCANIAKRSVIPALLEIPDFELVAVASRTISKASEFATIFGCEAIEGYDNLIDREDIDALYIPLPTGLHEEFIVKALPLISESLESTFILFKAVSSFVITKSLTATGLSFTGVALMGFLILIMAVAISEPAEFEI
jgi:hypothetical protein